MMSAFEAVVFAVTSLGCIAAIGVGLGALIGYRSRGWKMER